MVHVHIESWYLTILNIHDICVYIYIVWKYLKTDVDVEKPRRSYFLAAVMRQGASKKTNGQLFPFYRRKASEVGNWFVTCTVSINSPWVWLNVHVPSWYDDIAWACGKKGVLGKASDWSASARGRLRLSVCFCWCPPMIQWICFRQKMQETVVFTHIYP